MDMTGERRIPAPRQAVWDALNDPLVLQASIPGCQSLDKLSDREMKAVAAVKIGPISARFAGTVRLDDLDPPNGYSINGEGQGGAAGFAKGGAKVALDGDAADETEDRGGRSRSATRCERRRDGGGGCGGAGGSGSGGSGTAP